MENVNRPTLVENKGRRFLIMDAPTDGNLSKYVTFLKKKNVTHVVRACEATYSIAPLTDAGIQVTDVTFKDGDPPPLDVVDKWLRLVDAEFKDKKEAVIAVHCVAGLGRAPVLVAIAIIESGMDPYETINFIRKRRRGAINAKQLKYLEDYKRKKPKDESNGCLIM